MAPLRKSAGQAVRRHKQNLIPVNAHNKKQKNTYNPSHANGCTYIRDGGSASSMSGEPTYAAFAGMLVLSAPTARRKLCETQGMHTRRLRVHRCKESRPPSQGAHQALRVAARLQKSRAVVRCLLEIRSQEMRYFVMNSLVKMDKPPQRAVASHTPIEHFVIENW